MTELIRLRYLDSKKEPQIINLEIPFGAVTHIWVENVVEGDIKEFVINDSKKILSTEKI